MRMTLFLAPSFASTDLPCFLRKLNGAELSHWIPIANFEYLYNLVPVEELVEG